MTLTITVPSYNKEKYIERCLKSILVEKKYIDKIILVDNYSTDTTFEIAKKYEPTIQCYRNDKNIGIFNNFNRCIELCKTDWLMIVHADDELEPGSISKYFDFIKKYPTVSLIHADSYMIDDDKSIKSISQQNKKVHWKANVKKELWKAGLDAMSCPYGIFSTIMVKKEVYDKLGVFFSSSLSADSEMWPRISSKYDVGYLSSPTAIYHVNKTSTGYDSLINREVREIKDDWDFLNKEIANHYPTKESQEAFIHKTFKDAPYAYWVVVKANIKARHYKKVFQALWLIIFTYHGIFPLIKLIFITTKKVIINKICSK